MLVVINLVQNTYHTDRKSGSVLSKSSNVLEELPPSPAVDTLITYLMEPPNDIRLSEQTISLLYHARYGIMQ